MSDKTVGFFEEPKTKQRLWKLLWAICILSVLLEIPLHRHGHFGDNSIDGIFGFYGLVGFIGCLLCVVIAKILGFGLKVKEGYYDDDAC